MTPEHEQFLREHNRAVLATGRRDGSPQASTIAYVFDGTHVVICMTVEKAKWHNVGRQPRVVVVVNDADRQVTVYGRAQRVTADPKRLQLVRQLYAAVGLPLPEDDAALARHCDEERRGALRITPESVVTYGLD